MVWIASLIILLTSDSKHAALIATEHKTQDLNASEPPGSFVNSDIKDCYYLKPIR